MPKGTWIREQTNERTAHRVPRLRGPTAAGTRVTWAFMVHSHVAHTTRHVSWVSDRALPDDARCIRPPFPPSSIRAAQPAIWSETWYGPGTQLANRWSGRFFLRGDGSCQSPNCSPPTGKTNGYLDPSPLWGLVGPWFPGCPVPNTAPAAERRGSGVPRKAATELNLG